MKRRQKPEAVDFNLQEATNQSHRSDPMSPYRNVMKALALAICLGMLAIVGYGIQAETIVEFASVSATGLLVGGASLAVGSLIGFLFGLPLTRQAGRESSGTEGETQDDEKRPGTPYPPNTNLEQISDWLTKILVGVGLTQLGGIAGSLRGMGEDLAPALGSFPSSDMFAVGILVYFLVCGFLVSFLWTRVNLPTLYAAVDLKAALAAAKKEGIGMGERRMVDVYAAPPREIEISQGKHILWVDDRPANNHSVMKMLEDRLGVEISTSQTTPEALNRVKTEPEEKYSLVISDMARPGDSRAGYTLLQELRAESFTMPFIIYSGSSRPEHDAEARRRGAEGSTNSPLKLLQLATIALSKTR
jgi:CheY-like chemotaxis protein